MYTLTIKLLSDVAFYTSVTAVKGYIFDAPRDWLGIPYIPASEIIGGRTLPCVGAKLGNARPDGYFGLLQAANRLQAIVRSSDTYINAFFNAAWYERNIPNNYFRDLPFGFGLGLSFDTKAGMFYLSYALGHQHNSPVSFKTGKIHFGVKVGF